MKNKYYDDFRCTELKTKVKEVVEENGFFWHVFEETIFYCDGKHDDAGFINQLEVLKLKVEKDTVSHLLSEKLEGDVLMVIHHARRYIHAQNETLSLLMNGVLKSVYRCDAIDHYLSDMFMVSRYRGTGLTNQQKNELQITLNGMIRDDFPVKISYEKITDERKVTIGLFPGVASDQIQVPSLTYIQMMKILEVVQKEDEFLILTICGDQMLMTLEKYYEIIKEASQILQCEPLYINSSIHKLLNKVKSN